MACIKVKYKAPYAMIMGASCKKLVSSRISPPARNAAADATETEKLNTDNENTRNRYLIFVPTKLMWYFSRNVFSSAKKILSYVEAQRG